MGYKVLNDFVSIQQVPQEVILAYKDKLPEALLSIWKSLGFGTLMNGYLKVINPRIYQEIIEDSYFRGALSIPIMVTGFGDVLTWEKNEYISIIKFRKGQFDIISFGFKYFFDDLSDDEYTNDHFNIEQYKEAITKHGELKFDECFGYVPLLGLGGPEDVNHLGKVKIIEHIAIITQLLGKIE